MATVSGAGAKWINSNYLYIGQYGHGTLTITGGSSVANISGFIGCYTGSIGEVTVSGTGSRWTNSYSLFVGNSGHGTLIITGGGIVTNNYRGYIGCDPGSIGEATVSGAGSKWTNSSDLLIGQYGHGTLTITGGGTVTNTVGYIGYYAGFSGEVTASGAGSRWTNSSYLYIGYSGHGTITITGGGTVTNNFGYIGYNAGSTGEVTVNGIDSKWMNSNGLYVGNSVNSTGSLNIGDGGTVTGTYVSINSSSLLSIDVGNGSTLNINNGSGGINNNGKVRIFAGAGAIPGETYTPISASAYSGSGTYQAIGGKWNSTNHTFTASVVQQGSSNTPLTINLASLQRIQVTDDANHWTLGASFAPSANTINFTATTISDQLQDKLKIVLDADQSLLCGWQITTNYGISAGNPAYLSFDVGLGRSRGDITVWHYNGTTWSQFDATDLICNSGYASFTVTGFSGYAISAVPEPGPLALLAIGLLSISLVHFRRKANA